jgi:hypothetical protein
MNPDDAVGAAILGQNAQQTSTLGTIPIGTPRAILIDTINRLTSEVNKLSSGSRLLEYTPVLSNGTNTIGNGELRGRYVKTGAMVWFEITMTWGSTTAISSSATFPYFTLPLPAVDDGIDRATLGDGAWFPLPGSYRIAYDPTSDATTINQFGVMRVDTERIFISWDSTTPTPATYQNTGDVWRIGGFYVTE